MFAKAKVRVTVNRHFPVNPLRLCNKPAANHFPGEMTRAHARRNRRRERRLRLLAR